MSRTITIDVFDPSSVDAAVRELREYAEWVQRKANELVERLANYGLQRAELVYSGALYTGPKDFNVTVERRGENSYAIVASGDTVLILEFGAGVTYGYGHPQAGAMGYGPGTYPGQTHAMTGKGWYLPKEKGGEHTYGNPPSMAMYNTAKSLEMDLERMAREVFSS